MNTTSLLEAMQQPQTLKVEMDWEDLLEAIKEEKHWEDVLEAIRKEKADRQKN